MNNEEKKTQEIGAKLKELGILYMELDGEMIHSLEQCTSDLVQELE